MFTLIIEDKNGTIADEYSFEEGEFTIGRSHVNDIILPADNISRRHARLFTQNKKCYIEDLSSSNGVYVNGKRIMSTQELGQSAQIKIGDFFLYVEGVNYDGSNAPATGLPATTASAASGDEGEEVYCRLISQNFGQPGTAFTIGRPVNLVGRGKDCNLTIIDPSISRIQSKITIEKNNQVRVEDLKSANGTYVNGMRIEKAHLQHGDKLRFGNVEFIVEMPNQPPISTDGLGQLASSPARYGSMSQLQGPAPYGAPRKRNIGLITVLVILILILAGMVTYIAFPSLFVSAPKDEPKKETKPVEPKPKPKPKVDPYEEKIKKEIADAESLLKQARWTEAAKVFNRYKLNSDKAAKLYKIALEEQKNKVQLQTAMLYLKQKQFAFALRYVEALPKGSHYVRNGDQARQITQIRDAMRVDALQKADAACQKREYRTCHDGLIKVYGMKADETLAQRIKKLERYMKRRRIRFSAFAPKK
ncbi:MAG: FHA domain-containing protein [Myxococcales bacterium]|nr:FHA domain-containing protein [Myxococcales bacterium]